MQAVTLHAREKYARPACTGDNTEKKEKDKEQFQAMRSQNYQIDVSNTIQRQWPATYNITTRTVINK